MGLWKGWGGYLHQHRPSWVSCKSETGESSRRPAAPDHWLMAQCATASHDKQQTPCWELQVPHRQAGAPPSGSHVPHPGKAAGRFLW